MIRQLNSQIKDLREANKDLLNRVQAGDLKGYLALQTSDNTGFPEVPYISKTDEAELEQLRTLGRGQEIGYDIYDDAELGDTLSEFGNDSEFILRRAQSESER